MDDKYALITGASKGIGRAVAIEAARAGLTVFAVGRNQNDLHRLQMETEGLAGECVTRSVDLLEQGQTEELISSIKQVTAHLSLVVHSAGIAKVGKIEDFKRSDWQLTMGINLYAPFLLTQSLMPVLKAGSHMFFINSIAGITVFPDWAAYSVSKHGLRALADTLRLEVGHRGVKVTSVFPASVATSMQDKLPYNWDKTKMLSAEQVAKAVLECYSQPQQVLIKNIDIENMAGVF